MSRPVPIVPEVTGAGDGDGRGGRTGTSWSTPGPGGAATGLGPRHRRRPRRLGPVDGSVGGRAGADAAGEATGFRERRRIGVSELQRRTLHPAEPARPRRRARPGGRAVRPARAKSGRGVGPAICWALGPRTCRSTRAANYMNPTPGRGQSLLFSSLMRLLSPRRPSAAGTPVLARAGLALILGGTDRAAVGYVVDFRRFNVADSAITVARWRLQSAPL